MIGKDQNIKLSKYVMPLTHDYLMNRWISHAKQ